MREHSLVAADVTVASARAMRARDSAGASSMENRFFEG